MDSEGKESPPAVLIDNGEFSGTSYVVNPIARPDHKISIGGVDFNTDPTVPNPEVIKPKDYIILVDQHLKKNLQKQLKRTKLFFQKAHYHFEGP
jgi:hypothetical protein